VLVRGDFVVSVEPGWPGYLRVLRLLYPCGRGQWLASPCGWGSASYLVPEDRLVLLASAPEEVAEVH
jgi:hypothetical protein